MPNSIALIPFYRPLIEAALNVTVENSNPTAIRISMLSFTLVSLMLALAFAVTGWLTKDASFEQRLRVVAMCGTFLLSAITWLGLFGLQRYRSEIIAGKVFFQFERVTILLPRLSSYLKRVVIVLYMCATFGAPFIYAYQVVTVKDEGPFYVCILNGLFGGIMLAFIPPMLWNQTVWICDHGLLRGYVIIPWKRFKDFYFHPRDASVVILVGHSFRYAIRIDPTKSNEVLSILRQQLSLQIPICR